MYLKIFQLTWLPLDPCNPMRHVCLIEYYEFFLINDWQLHYHVVALLLLNDRTFSPLLCDREEFAHTVTK